MNAAITAKPYEVGERVRLRSDEGLEWHEGPVTSIDAMGYLFIKTAPWIQSDGTEVDVDFVILNADRTDAAYSYEIQRVEDAPEQDDAATRVLKTSLAWHATDSDDITALREAFWAMKDAIAEYAAVTQ